MDVVIRFFFFSLFSNHPLLASQTYVREKFEHFLIYHVVLASNKKTLFFVFVFSDPQFFPAM